MNITRKVTLLGACLVAAAALAACGSSSSSSSSSASAAVGSSSATGASGSFAAARTKFTACLKAHGVTLPNRPGGFRRRYGGGNGPAGGGAGAPPPGGFGGGGGGFLQRFRSNPKLAAAFKACASDLPRGGFRGRFARPRHALITKFVTCVRQHGYKLPEPNFSGKGPVFPPRIQSNSKFLAASRACQSLLRPPGGARPGSGGGSGAGGAPSSA